MSLKKLFLAFVLGIGLVACSNDDNLETTAPTETGNTFVNVSIKLNTSQGEKALPGDYNQDGTYEGIDIIKNLDLYMVSPDGTMEVKRFAATDLSIDNNILTLNQPFRTSPGSKQIFLIVNNPNALGTTAPAQNDLWDIAGLASIQSDSGLEWDVITMTGRSVSPITIQPDITQQAVTTGANNFSFNVTRLASRAIVTSSAGTDLNDPNGVKIGTISNVTYSVAQGTNKIYFSGQAVANGNTGTFNFTTWGSDYIPVLGDYATQATKYYVYSDLSTPAAVPAKPADDNYKSLKGKFLFENTHTAGDVNSSGYKKGNTAYVLVKAILTPEQSAIADGGTLTNNTFYVGESDGKIYSSKEAAQTAVFNQRVALYQGGKVLYYAWLNPDVVNKPLNSPVLRNNIYHVNITGFGKIGLNWNPLYPEDPDNPNPGNPDPKPQNPDEPDTPIVPTDPLTPQETYMSVDISVLNWTVHSYDIEL